MVPRMDREQLVKTLLATLDDGRMTRAERQAVASGLASSDLPDATRRAVATALLSVVADRAKQPEDKALIEWLSDVIGLLWAAPSQQAPAQGGAARAYFGPEDPMAETLMSLLDTARVSIDVAVFTITDNRVADTLLRAHRRKVKVRVMTDDDKQWDEGSDVRRLADAGVPVVLDKSPHHFHHKFAVIDDTVLVTGSYNWTRGAALDNRENFLVTRERGLVETFNRAFERLWQELSSP